MDHEWHVKSHTPHSLQSSIFQLIITLSCLRSVLHNTFCLLYSSFTHPISILQPKNFSKHQTSAKVNYVFAPQNVQKVALSGSAYVKIAGPGKRNKIIDIQRKGFQRQGPMTHDNSNNYTPLTSHFSVTRIFGAVYPAWILHILFK